MEKITKQCPMCGGGPMEHTTRDVPCTYKNQGTSIADVTGDFCAVCGEYMLDPVESRRVSNCMLAFNKQGDARR